MRVTSIFVGHIDGKLLRMRTEYSYLMDKGEQTRRDFIADMDLRNLNLRDKMRNELSSEKQLKDWKETTESLSF